jgi:hypothetical protein
MASSRTRRESSMWFPPLIIGIKDFFIVGRERKWSNPGFLG